MQISVYGDLVWEYISGCTAAGNAAWMKEHLEALLGVVPELLECEVGIDIAGDGNYNAWPVILKFRL